MLYILKQEVQTKALSKSFRDAVQAAGADPETARTYHIYDTLQGLLDGIVTNKAWIAVIHEDHLDLTDPESIVTLGDAGYALAELMPSLGRCN